MDENDISIQATAVLPPGSTSSQLQTAIDNAAFGDVILISGDMPFVGTVTVRTGLEVTVRSAPGEKKTLYQFVDGIRHFAVNGSLILEEIIVDGMSRGGGVQLNVGAFAFNGGVVMQNCRAVNGGAVYVDRGVFAIYGGNIINNEAENGGGVYMNMGMFNMSDFESVISGNKADNGGGVYMNSGTFSLSGGTVDGNEAENGGGLYLLNGSLRMTYGNFVNNKSSENGGGIYAASGGSIDMSGTRTMAVTGNTAGGDGGGVYTAGVDYANIATSAGVQFRGNKAAAAYVPPAGAGTQYPLIQFSGTSISNHPLNNYDINYTGGLLLTYHIDYNANGGIGSHTGPEVNPGDECQVIAPEAVGISYKGYTFMCWNTRADGRGTDYNPGDEITMNGNITLYAQWRIQYFDINYEPNGGTGYYSDDDIPYGTRYTILSDDLTGIKRGGYTFVNWNTRSDGMGDAYEPGDIITVESDLTLYARWSLNLYDVCYDANGGTGGYIDPNIPHGLQYRVKSDIETGIARHGYTFVNWNTRPDNTGVTYEPDDIFVMDSGVTLYAQWEINLYDVCYNANGGKGSHIDPNVPYGTGYTVITPKKAGISRTCHTFVGWNTEPDGTGEQYAPGDVITITEDIELFAQWKPGMETKCDKYCDDFCERFCRGCDGECYKKCSRNCLNICYDIPERKYRG